MKKGHRHLPVAASGQTLCPKRESTTTLLSSLSEIECGNAALERAVLGKGIAGQRRALRSLRHLNADSWRVWSLNPCRAQHGILRKNLAVYLGYQIILAISIAAPYLPELNRSYRHKIL